MQFDIGLREDIDLRHVICVPSAVLLLAIKGGQAAELLSPGDLCWPNSCYDAAVSLAIAGMRWLSRSRPGTATAAPKADRLLRAIAFARLVMVLPYGVAVPSLAPWAMGLFAGLLGVGCGACALQRMRSTCYDLVSFGMLFVDAVVVLIRTVGWMPTKASTTDVMQRGATLEMLLPPFMQADRCPLIAAGRDVGELRRGRGGACISLEPGGDAGSGRCAPVSGQAPGTQARRAGYRGLKPTPTRAPRLGSERPLSHRRAPHGCLCRLSRLVQPRHDRRSSARVALRSPPFRIRDTPRDHGGDSARLTST